MFPTACIASRSSGSSLEPETITYLANVVTAGGVIGNSTLVAADVFVKACKSSAIWTKLNRVNLFCGDFTASLVPLKAGSGSATETNHNFTSGMYNETGATGGLKANGSTTYLDTGYNPVGASASSSSVHLMIYVQGVEAGGTTRMAIGSRDGSNLNYMFLAWANGGSQEVGCLTATDSSQYSPTPTLAATQGQMLITTNGSRSQKYYNGGFEIVTAVTASGSFYNGNIFVCCQNGAGTPLLFSTRYFRAYSVGTGLSATDVTNYYNAIQVFQIALDRDVFVGRVISSLTSSGVYCGQGLDTDGTYIYSSGTEGVSPYNGIRKYDRAGSTIATVGRTSPQNEHYGDLCLQGGKLYAIIIDELTGAMLTKIVRYDLDLTNETVIATISANVGHGGNSLSYSNGYWIVGETSALTTNFAQNFFIFDSSWNFVKSIDAGYATGNGLQSSTFKTPTALYVLEHDNTLRRYAWDYNALTLTFVSSQTLLSQYHEGIAYDSLNTVWYVQNTTSTKIDFMT